MMKRMLACGAVVLGAALGLAPERAMADAGRWLDGQRPDALLELTSFGGADAAVRGLTRRAQVDWMPPVHRLLSVSRMTPGADMDRPVAIGFFAGEAGAGGLDFVAVIPGERPAVIAANFDAVPSMAHAGLFEFVFAGEEYFARVLSDDHLAISNAPARLGALQQGDDRVAGETDAPMVLTMRGDRGAMVLASLFDGLEMDLGLLDSMPEFGDEVERVRLALTPSAAGLRVDFTLHAAAGSDAARAWSEGNGSAMEGIPFPSGDFLLVAQMQAQHVVVRELLLNELSGVLGIDARSFERARSLSVLVGAPGPMFGGGMPAVSLAIESEDSDAVRSEIGRAIRAVRGGSYTAEASRRVGVALDHWSVPMNGAGGNGAQATRSGPALGMFGGGSGRPGARQNQSTTGRVFTRHGRVYMTTATQENGLDRLIAFGPDSKPITEHPGLNELLEQLPAGAVARGALNTKPLVTIAVGALNFAGERVAVPESLPPVVASMAVGDGTLTTTLIVPVDVVLMLERFRKASAQMGGR